MTPARRAEIEAYIQRLDLDLLAGQLPPWTVEQTIIRDLFEAIEAARNLHIRWSHQDRVMCETCTDPDGKYQPWPCATIETLGGAA
jgi:hypothetical protein